jgi:hypothetical protein
VLGRSEALEAAIRTDGDVIYSANGDPRVHPATSELRQLSATIGRLISQLQLPDEHGATLPTAATIRNRKGAHAQRAGADISELASRAAMARWHPGSA